jgi:hypothetical protein
MIMSKETLVRRLRMIHRKLKRAPIFEDKMLHFESFIRILEYFSVWNACLVHLCDSADEALRSGRISPAEKEWMNPSACFSATSMSAFLVFWCSNRVAPPGAFRRVVSGVAPRHGPLRQVGFLHVRR